MATTTTTTETKPDQINLKGGAGKSADINLNANFEKFNQHTTDEEYNHAVSLIETNLDKFGPVNALFAVNLGPNQPEVVIDARQTPALLSKLEQGSPAPADFVGRLHVRPHMIQRWVDGLMEGKVMERRMCDAVMQRKDA